MPSLCSRRKEKLARNASTQVNNAAMCSVEIDAIKRTIVSFGMALDTLAKLSQYPYVCAWKKLSATAKHSHSIFSPVQAEGNKRKLKQIP
eukprot:scaffold50231_cov20-Tisochrysis_lutea.AAC.1